MKVLLSYEVISPLFMGGANARTNPEIRAPSVRGVARYWLRALVAGSSLTQGSNDSSSVREIEEAVFGSTRKAGAIALTVVPDPSARVATFTKDRAILTREGDYLPTGKDYLFWSMAASGRKGTDRYQPAREYLEPGTKFQITLRARLESDEPKMRQALAALWLVGNLGALGSRANRGAGSVYFEFVAPFNDLPSSVCSTPAELRDALSKGLAACLATLGQGVAWRQATTVTLFDTLAPGACRIWVVAGNPKWRSYTDALNGIGGKLRDFRSYRNPLGQRDHDAVLNWMKTGGKGPEIKRAIFGLPIPFRYSNGGPSDVIVSEVSDRRASPLHIKLARLADGSYVGVLTLFKSTFLNGARLRLQSRKQWTAPTPQDYSVIENFVDTFDPNARWEVKL